MNVIQEEAERKLRYKNLSIDFQRMWNMKFVIQVIIGATGIALGYGLDYRGSRVRFPVGAVNFSFRQHVQNGSGSHPASYPMGTRGLFPWG
jgi:hypothetical protein